MRKLKAVSLICIIITLIVSLGGCSVFSGEYTKKEKLTLNSSGCIELQIMNRVGSIEIKQASNDILSIEAVKKVKCKDKSLENSIMENIKIRVYKEGSKAMLKAVTASDETVDLWDWKDGNLQDTNISVSYIVHVPKNIKLYNVNSEIGGIDISGAQAVLYLKTDIGKIKLSNVAIEGDSSIVTGNGSLDINLSNIINAQKIDLSTDIGSIDIKLPKSFVYRTSSNEAQFTTKSLDIINDNTTIKVTAGLGKVRIDGKSPN